MTTRKNYNSVIFLTTLSVYLGLVLVGAPATVLAQAALTSNIEVKDKIEKRDDLDKKPSDEEAELSEADNQAILDYVSVVKILLEASRQANANHFAYESEAKSDSSGSPQFKRIRFTPLNGHEPDRRQVFALIDSELRKLFKVLPAQSSYDESNVIASFKLNDKGFTTESKFLQKDAPRAQELSTAYNLRLERLRRETVSEYQALILKHTEILAENIQLVVTRLPRGSLDVLLVKDSAK